jgi:hypothetical protein
MHTFPVGLTYLEIYAINEVLAPGMLPLSLQTLILYSLESTCVIPVGFLPAGLTKLHIGGYEGVLQQNVLPVGLTSLFFSGNFASDAVIEACVSLKNLSKATHTTTALPPNIQNLKLQACSSSADIYSTSLTNLEWQFVFATPIRCALPQSLTTFYCHNGFDDIAKLLPPTVTNLTIAYESFTCALPQNLVKLHFVYPKYDASMRSSSFIRCQQLTHLSFCPSVRTPLAHVGLPDSITHLDLGGATSLPLLPPNLRCLSLSHEICKTIEHWKFQRAVVGDNVTLYFY